jgi:hypothetical protein
MSAVDRPVLTWNVRDPTSAGATAPMKPNTAAPLTPAGLPRFGSW